MINRIADIAVLVVAGVIIANLVQPGRQTGTLVNGVTGLWQTSINGLLGKTA